ncbi:hypothetical protein E8E12_010238 [Didymella heteroderae]|uniref:Uncharacterized protein n=1 Tax=Didymella heteroderae TaxID=1769908 RepID=A0A9P4X1I8_9PLEO|nr:hypothetical protein E8E12_010238 [Didymella heteroderae]
MGDLAEQQVEPLAATEKSEGLQAPPKPSSTVASMAPATDAKKRRGKLSIFSRHKKDKLDKSAERPITSGTACESSKNEEDAAPFEGIAPHVEHKGDVPPGSAAQPSSAVFNNIGFAGPSSSAPPPTDWATPATNPHLFVPIIKITPATPRAQSITGTEMSDYLLAAPKLENRLDDNRANISKPDDKKDQYPLRIPEEPGDYPHITGPRNLKKFGRLPYETRHVYIPLARHWVDHRPIANWLISGVKIHSQKEADYEDHRLALYFLRRHGIAHLRYCNILEFIEHIKRWREIPNPAHVLELGVPVQYMGSIAWTHIVKRMRDLEIDPHKLDMQQYQVLQNITTYRILTAALLEMKQADEDGTYDERFKKWNKGSDKVLFDWQTRIMNNRRQDSGMNNRRFSHRYPKGIDADDPRSDPSLQACLEAKKAERSRADKEAAKQATAAGSPLLPPPDQVEQQKSRKKWYAVVFLDPVQRVKTWSWSYIIFSLLIFTPLIGGSTWAIMSSGTTDKFTDHIS